MEPTKLYPVYSPKMNSQVFFSRKTRPVNVVYPPNDPLQRSAHKTRALKVPVVIPNYMGLCTVPGQKQWTPMDEISPSSLGVDRVGVSMLLNGNNETFFITTNRNPFSPFSPSPEANGHFDLRLKLVGVSGFDLENEAGEKIGETVFAGFKEAGWEPQFSFTLNGRYSRQLGQLKLTSDCKGITAIKDVKTGKLIKRDDSTFSPEGIFESVSNVEIFAAQLSQDLA